MNQRELKKIWNQVPPDYYQSGIERNLLQRFWHSQKINTFKKIVIGKNFSKILDVGCASGRMANEIWKIYPRSKVVGVDTYKKALDFGHKRYPHIKFIHSDAHKLPFRSNSFDLIICYEVIEHVVNPIDVLSEIKRVVKKDGLAIVVMDSGNLLFRIIWLIWENTKGKVWRGAHLHPFHHTELEDVINKSGLTIKNKIFSHFGMEVSFVLKK